MFFVFVRVKDAKDALSGPELLSQLQHKLFGIASVSLVSVHRLVEPIECLQRYFWVLKRYTSLGHVPLVEVNEEPKTVNYGSKRENWQSKDEIEKASQDISLLATVSSHFELEDHYLDPCYRRHHQATHEEHHCKKAAEWEVDYLADSSVKMLKTAFVFDAVIEWPEEISKQTDRRGGDYETTISLVILVAWNGFNDAH